MMLAHFTLAVSTAALLAFGAPDPVADRLAAMAGDYQGGFHGDAAPGCGFATALTHPDVWRIEASGTKFRFTTRSPSGNMFVYTGVATIEGDRTIVRGTYTATNALGTGTFVDSIDAHDGSAIVAQSFASTTTTACHGTGVDAGIRTGDVGSSTALPAPTPFAP